ncbi:MAG: beta-phosphoglucomutase [Lachnospiraceae bacterium]|nr:beta-phosphoglucomutase [Lachnospiraceae bacterium]
MLQAVIFDLDGVITDSAKYHFEAWKEIASKLQIPFDETYNEKLKGVSRLESLNLILDNGPGRDSFSESEKEALCTEKNEIYKELIKKITPSDLLPGIERLLKECKEAGLKIGLASVSKNAPFIMERLQISEYFDHVADAAKIKRSKPFPDIFSDCVESFNLLPANCIGIEDAKAGIEAIHAAGMKAVGVGSPDQMEEADLVLSGTFELNLQKLRSL